MAALPFFRHGCRRTLAPSLRTLSLKHLRGFRFSSSVVSEKLKEVSIVDDEKSAEEALKVLYDLPPDAWHACDTEVVDIDLDKSPIGQVHTTYIVG